ncbi:MAG: uracil-DNA glycosylase family protein [Actinomycetota bacterium]|nr:uracil-DNA glycosylase family protein [Actinomycetota bacterium]
MKVKVTGSWEEILTTGHEHYCDDPENFPIDKFLQLGTGAGARVLVVGESPARDGWRESGRAFYNVEGKPIRSHKNLNELLTNIGLTVEECGFTELVKCYVGKDRRLLRECGHRCWPVFKRQLEKRNFRFLLLLGAKTLEIFNREADTELRVGELTTVEVSDSRYSVLPIYHPSPINPNNHPNNCAIFNELSGELDALLSRIA